MSRPYLPIASPKDVIPYLASPTHWRDGYSAKAIAEAWFCGLPRLVEHTLRERCSTDVFKEIDLVEVFLEKKIALGDSGRPSQADALAILGLPNGLAVMAVEGKVREPFGQLVGDWLAGARPNSEKPTRLHRPRTMLGLLDRDVTHLRYQLFHRTASALLEARRYRAKVALMMVHSFDHADSGVSDFQAFASAMGFLDAGATKVVGPVICQGINLYLGWTADRVGNEGFSIVDGRMSDAGFFDDDI